jgi:hypothetical protein
MVSEIAEDPTVGRPCTVDVRHWRERIRESGWEKDVRLVVKV